MEDWRRKVEEVYAKWEKKGRGSPTKNDRTTRSFVVPRPPLYSSRAGRLGRRKHQKQGAGFEQPPSFVPSLGVDVNALHAANNRKYVSISRCCQKCVPASKNKHYSETSSAAGLQDLLKVDVRKYSGFPWRFFPYVTYIYHTPNATMSDLRSDTLQSRRVRDAIESCSKAAVENGESGDYSGAVRSQEKRARGIVYSMSSGVYSTLVKVVGWLVFHVFGQLFNGLYVQKRHIHMLKEAQQKGVPLVFLPSHKSHMDYIIMTFVLFSMGVRIPRIAAGDNLRLPVVSWLVSHLGGFFIKRKLDTSAGKDVLYRKCLHEYMERVLYSGDNIEFFIDGSRSRSGKHNSPKAGLLSVLVDSVKEGVVEDIMIVPVSITYDKLMERNFVRHELMGGNKKPETVMQVLRGAWYMVSKNIGSVRVDFAQPFSLQEYLSSAVVSPHSVMELSNVSRSRSILNLAEHTQRKLVTALSHHITYEFQNCSSLMSPNIVAFLMLTKYRDGVKYSDLVEDYQWLEGMAVKRGKSMAFTGEPSEAVHYALRYLGDLVVLEDGSSTTGVTLKNHVLKPCLSLPDVFELLHHSNQVSPMFVLEAVVACSLQCLLGDQLLRGRVDNSSVVEISREELIEEALFLCKLLAREFIFAPPCVDIWSALMETVESFVNSEVLKMPETVLNHYSGRRLPCSAVDSDESDQETDVMLQVNCGSKSLEYLQFLQRILDPFLEAYWMATISLLQMKKDTALEEMVFLKQLQGTLFEKMERGVLQRVESCSMDTLRNAVKSLVDMSVISYRNTTQISVSDADQLMEIAESIVDFKSFS